MRLAVMLSLISLCGVLNLLAAGETKSPDREALEKAFVDQMTGAVLVGTFSVDGKPGAKPERYEIDSVKKHKGDDWIVTARIKYGEHDLKVPLVVQVYWAGDTPMLSLTNLTIPGLGTFTSRVMFHGQRYAGTWQHGEVGGHLWGLIEKATDQKKAKKDSPANEEKSKN